MECDYWLRTDAEDGVVFVPQFGAEHAIVYRRRRGGVTELEVGLVCTLTDEDCVVYVPQFNRKNVLVYRRHCGDVRNELQYGLMHTLTADSLDEARRLAANWASALISTY